MQREIEAGGIPTISLSNNAGVSERVRPPRWVHVRFPRGAMLGEPGNVAKQRAVLGDVWTALAGIDVPGGHVALDYRWEAEPLDWRGRKLTDGS